MNYEFPYWIKECKGKVLQRDKKEYICVSGLSVSGVLHVGKLRDILIADLLHKALLKDGVESKLIYFIDDFDKLKKLPKNSIQNGKKLEGMPYCEIPDIEGNEKNFVNYYLYGFLNCLATLEINPKIIKESERHLNGDYTKQMKTIFDNRLKIKRIVDNIRNKNFEISNLFSVYCSSCKRDAPINKRLLDNGNIKYLCTCGYEDKIDILTPGRVKMSWIANWASRWDKEQTDFEPIGPDHACPKGSFEVSKKIYEEIFNGIAPTVQQYGFINLKGGRKMSSSGNSLSLEELLRIYEPEIILDLFKQTKPTVFFDIDLGEDVIRKYEEYDKKHKLSKDIKSTASFKTIVSILSYNFLDETYVKEKFRESSDITERISRAKYWLKEYSPEEYKFELRNKPINKSDINEQEVLILNEFIKMDIRNCSEKEIEQYIYDLGRKFNLPAKDIFSLFYRVLIDRKDGPKISKIIKRNDQNKIINLLNYTF